MTLNELAFLVITYKAVFSWSNLALLDRNLEIFIFVRCWKLFCYLVITMNIPINHPMICCSRWYDKHRIDCTANRQCCTKKKLPKTSCEVADK